MVLPVQIDNGRYQAANTRARQSETDEAANYISDGDLRLTLKPGRRPFSSSLEGDEHQHHQGDGL
jgi:hypothetical protein